MSTCRCQTCGMLKVKATRIDRYFGKCFIAGCKKRRVVEGAIVNGVSIFNGRTADLQSIGCWCDDHNVWLKWSQLEGRYSDKKECNGVCMGATGPSCDCSCGGENHGKNHI